MDALAEKAAGLPSQPGVYIFKDDKGQVIYVGKAVNLKNRVRAYFNETDERPQIQFLRPRIKDIEFVVTDTEKEALILENNLIRKHQPRYNIRLRDDKSFLYLKLTTSEKFPRLILVRRGIARKKNQDMVFGPFASARAVRETVRLLQNIFPVLRCATPRFHFRDRPCVNYEMDRCPAACAGLISEQAYKQGIDQLVRFLRGEGKDLVSELEAEMNAASEKTEFEKAGRIRDRIQAIKDTLEKQKVEVNAPVDRDVIGYHREADRAVVFRLGYRQGMLIIGHPYLIRNPRLEDKEALGSFLKQFYLGQSFIPKEILLPFAIEDQDLLKSSLEDQAKRQVEVSVPERGEKRAMVELAHTNAKQALEASAEKEKLRADALQELKRIFSLKKVPGWIECYDISNLGEKLAVGSMVKFLDGEPDKSGYRRYRIKGIDTQNDFEMMREVLFRRFKRALAEEQEMPDLIILDGGKGQLNIALEVLKELGIRGIDAVALAKEREIGKALSDKLEKKPERVYLPGRKDPVRIKREPAKSLMTRIRDEAHRFAITYHRKLRRKAFTRSIILEIPGIGPKKQRALLKFFKSVKKIREANADALSSVPGISKSDIDHIRSFFSAGDRHN